MFSNQQLPLFSIITVCFNSEKTIEKTIQSVLGQSYEDFEYIIVDGNSTDGTMQIVEKYRDCISTIISEPDKGLYHAMNKGIAIAKGKVIGIINSDDWYEPNALEWVARAYENSDHQTVFYGLCKYFENGNESKILSYHHNSLPVMMISHPSVFVPSLLYEKLGAFNVSFKISADYELLLRFFQNGVPFFRIERVLANYRSGGVSDIKSTRLEEAKIHLLHGQISRKRYLIRWLRYCINRVIKPPFLFIGKKIFRSG